MLFSILAIIDLLQECLRTNDFGQIFPLISLQMLCKVLHRVVPLHEDVLLWDGVEIDILNLKVLQEG